MKYLVILPLLFFSSISTAERCQGLSWRLATVDGQFATYRGKVKPGSASVIYLELRNNRKLIGQGDGYPNPNGSWEISLYADYNVRKSHRESFFCEK